MNEVNCILHFLSVISPLKRFWFKSSTRESNIEYCVKMQFPVKISSHYLLQPGYCIKCTTPHLRNCLLHLKSEDYFPIVMWESERISSTCRVPADHLLQVSSVNTQIYCHAVAAVTPWSRSQCFVFSIRYCYLHAISVKETNQQNILWKFQIILKTNVCNRYGGQYWYQ